MAEDLGSGAAAPENAAGDTLESAAANVAGDARASPHHDESWAAREKRRAEEEARLQAWAEAHGKLGGRKVEEKIRGSEHILEPDAPNGRWIKQTRPEMFSGFGLNLNNTGQGATPGEYLHRLTLNNRLFEDDVRLERVVRNDPKLLIVTSQTHIKGRAASPSEIDATMESKGFEKLALGAYYHAGERILVHDMHSRNAVFSQGVAVPIDPAIQHATPAFAAFLKANPHLLDPR